MRSGEPGYRAAMACVVSITAVAIIWMLSVSSNPDPESYAPTNKTNAALVAAEQSAPSSFDRRLFADQQESRRTAVQSKPVEARVLTFGYTPDDVGHIDVSRDVRPSPLNPPDRDQRSNSDPAEPGTASAGELAQADRQMNKVIRGRVMTASGHAVTGATVSATALQLNDMAMAAMPPAERVRVTTTDTNGHYLLASLAAGEYRVAVQPAGTTNSFTRREARLPAGVSNADFVVEAMHKFEITGTVTNEHAAPLPGAVVQPLSSGAGAVLSDQQGRFRIRLAIPDTTALVSLRTELIGYETVVTAVDVQTSPVVPATIRLPAAGESALVSGRLRAEDGAIVAGQPVFMRSRNDGPVYSSVSDEDGRFQVGPVALRRGNEFRLVVLAKNGYAQFEQLVVVQADGVDLQIQLASDLRPPLVGRMVDAHGAPLAGYTVQVRNARPPYSTTQVTGDNNGLFRVLQPPQGPLVFETRGRPRHFISGYQTDDNRTPIELVLDVGVLEIHGRISGPDGVAVVPEHITATWNIAHGPSHSAATRVAVADANGTFSFSGLGPGIHQLTVEARGFEKQTVEHDPVVNGSQLQIRLSPLPQT